MSDWIIRLIEAGGYAGVFLLMLLETVFPPVPSEVVMPIAGLHAADGSMSLAGVIASGTAGAMLGNLFWYGIARWIRESSGQTFRILDGALYTALHRLEERGWVQSEWGHTEQGKRAKFYRLTAAGRKQLAVETEQWRTISVAIAAALQAT